MGAGAALFASSALAEGWKAPEKNTVRGGFDEVVACADVQPDRLKLLFKDQVPAVI